MKRGGVTLYIRRGEAVARPMKPVGTTGLVGSLPVTVFELDGPELGRRLRAYIDEQCAAAPPSEAEQLGSEPATVELLGKKAADPRASVKNWAVVGAERRDDQFTASTTLAARRDVDWEYPYETLPLTVSDEDLEACVRRMIARAEWHNIEHGWMKEPATYPRDLAPEAGRVNTLG